METGFSSYKYEITVLLLNYNSGFERIRKTIVSILEQKDISLQIIISDDGSEINHKEKIEKLFESCHFSDYRLVLNAENHGTVSNYYSGLNVSEGEYLKAISPGDFLYDNHVLRNWIDFLKESGAEWSFSDAIFYNGKSNACVSVNANPDNVKLYLKGSPFEKRWNYVVIQDIPLGAAMISKTSIQKLYLPRILDKGIKYGEDNMWRLMMFDGVVCSFYDKPTIFYEYGEGISTNKNRIWYDRIRKDCGLTGEIMAETPNPDSFQKKMLESINPNKSLLRKLQIKGLLFYRIKRKINPRKTIVKQYSTHKT